VNLRGRGQYPAITPRAGCSLARQAACKVAASAVGVRISPRPPCFHGPADRTPVSETGSRRFESSWKRAWHGTRWCGRQSAKLPLAGSTPARVSSVLTLWTAGDGWHLGESKLAGYLPPLMEWCGFESRPPDYPAVAQSAERFTIRCAPPTFARLPVVPGRRHRACGAGTGRRPPVTCLKNRNPPAVGASSVPAPEARPGGSKTAGYPGTGKASRFESCSLPSRRHGAAQPQSVRSELRLPDPTSARAATLQPHPHPPGRAGEPK
jgi:hypothetical protein